MRGEIRRGYFVEGLSGVQYATAEAVDALAGLAPARRRRRADPAGDARPGQPLRLGGAARHPAAGRGDGAAAADPANFLVLIAGRPVLIVEGGGKRLTGLASASEAELRRAIALLPALAGPSRRVLKVETYNAAATLAGPAAPWLAEVGFVRDPPGMAFYRW